MVVIFPNTKMVAQRPRDQYPVAPTSPFPPPDAPVGKYREVMKSLGIDRVVVVQPSAYGKDNRCTVDAITELGPCARGVAVVDLDTPDAELQSLARKNGRATVTSIFTGQKINTPSPRRRHFRRRTRR